MKPSERCLNIIKIFEGCNLHAYKDPGSVDGLPITIGWGSVTYINGDKIRLGDIITQEQAHDLLVWEVNKKAVAINFLGVNWNQNQFDAITSFTYNIGFGALQKSTLLKKAKVNPNDPTIKDEFLRWNKNDGKVLKGLTVRRDAEQRLYFS